jgi:hypothetical protein
MPDWDDTIRRKVGRAGRPPAAHPRLKVYKVRANLAEQVMLSAAASAACLPIATFLRKRALGAVRFTVPKADFQTAAQLTRLGNLLNQVVALAHSGSAPAWPTQEMTELQNLCGRLAVLLTDSQQFDQGCTFDATDEPSPKEREAS